MAFFLEETHCAHREALVGLLCQTLSENDVREIIQKMKTVKYQPGTYIIQQGREGLIPRRRVCVAPLASTRTHTHTRDELALKEKWGP